MGSKSESPLVLLTGGTGHLGFKTLLDTLQAGYRVRAAVRSSSKKDIILSNPAFKALKADPDQLSFVEVADLAVPGAYDTAVKDVDFIIHIASPITTGNAISSAEYEKYFIEPAVRGTLGILESALAYGDKVKRVVITSSVVAITPFAWMTGGMQAPDVVNADSRIPDPKGPFEIEFAAYTASKAAALNASEKFMAERKPAFDLVNIHPSFIEGRDELVTSTADAMKGTNGMVLRVVTGVKAPYPLPGATVHNDDVARLHVEALQTGKIPAGSYIAQSNTPHGSLDGTRWEDINGIVEKQFPEAIKKGLVSNEGAQEHVAVRVDAAKTEKTFGWKLMGFEEQVKSVVGQYVELVEKEKASL
jgi:nucleoside-diphosphate-sugar epimerase